VTRKTNGTTNILLAQNATYIQFKWLY